MCRVRHVVRRLAAIGLISSVILGCGASAYNAAVESRIDRLKFGTKFLENLAPDPIPIVEDVVFIQLPAFFDDQSVSLRQGARARNGAPLSPQRIQPPFGPIPGFRYSYEKFVMVGNNNTQPVYIYVGSVPAADKSQAAVLAELKAASRLAADWQDVSLDTPDGGKLGVKKLSGKGQQPFELSSDGGDVMQLPGQFEAYVHSTPEVHVVVAFRASEEAAARSKIFQAAPLAVGSLVVESQGTGGQEI